jgi:hypothetical protein
MPQPGRDAGYFTTNGDGVLKGYYRYVGVLLPEVLWSSSCLPPILALARLGSLAVGSSEDELEGETSILLSIWDGDTV